MPGWLGSMEIGALMALLLLLVGPARLQRAGRSPQQSLRDWRDSLRTVTEKEDDTDEAFEPPPVPEAMLARASRALPAAQPGPPRRTVG